MEYQFTKENFNDEVMNSDIPVMVDFMQTGADHAR